MELEEVIEAYFDCRHNKRMTINALQFEFNYEQECIRLWEDIESRRYEPGRSIAFVIEHPVKREIFAADFRDRVVHHIIARRIYALLEAQFYIDSYSTQKGKGTLFGIQRVEQHIRECSENYTRDCYVMKLDISGYFMSIDKQRLYNCTMDFLSSRYNGTQKEKDELEFMLRKTIFNNPEKNCIRKMPKSRWKGLPRNKSLFGTDGTHGLPIGNLTSQLLALLFLDGLDHQITDVWGVQYYGRYVDDMVFVHPSDRYLLEVRQKIISWLKSRGLMLHPKKMYLQHYTKGLLFVGGMIKPGRKYISHRTQGRLFNQIYNFSRILNENVRVTDNMLYRIRATMNSYLGMMQHFNSLRLFHRVLRRISPDWYRYVYISKRGHRVKLVIRSRPKDAQASISLAA